jgi:hypothetical protein
MTTTEEPVFERLWHEVTRHVPHHHDDGHPAGAGHHNPQGETMLTIAQIHDAIDDGIGNIEGWAEDLKAKLPEIAATAERLDKSPIVQALQATLLPADVEQQIADLITTFGAKFPAATTTPQPVQPGDGTSSQPADAGQADGAQAAAQ